MHMTVLLAPSPSALQTLIFVLSRLKKMMYHIIQRKLCMSILPKKSERYKCTHCDSGWQGFVTEQKYLGVFISSDTAVDRDIKLRSAYCRGYIIIIRKFRKCTDEVKVQLFNFFCSNVYSGSLWSKSMLGFAAYNNILGPASVGQEGCL